MMIQDAAKYPELVQVAGLNHIEQALEAGNGVITVRSCVFTFVGGLAAAICRLENHKIVG